MPYPFGPVNGSRHDSFVLRESEIIDILRDVCQVLGQEYVLFGDSAYPISRWLWRMYKGAMTVFQAAFNMDMSPARVSVEVGWDGMGCLHVYMETIIDDKGSSHGSETQKAITLFMV